MNYIQNFAEAERALSRFIPPQRSFRKAYTLEHMQNLMEALGNPQNSYKTIHVAGTSGKSSTCYYLAALLGSAGKKVGLTISPHIDSIAERAQINLEILPEEIYCARLTEFLELVNETNIKPTYFELLVAFAYWLFAREKVDYAVIEVGLGGLLDGTNVITRSDKLCVLTDIGLDHTEILGKTIEQIAAQKAGIIKPHNVVFMYEQTDSVMEIVREVCDSQQAELHELLTPRPSDLPPLLPLFQKRNWYLALRAYKFVAARDKLKRLHESTLLKSAETYIPARMEMIRYGNKLIILDGAHNAQKMQALGSSIRRKFPRTRIATLLSLKQSKNFRTRTSLQEIIAISSHIIVTSFAGSQDMTYSAVDSRKVIEYARELGATELSREPDPEKAMELLLQRPEKILLITGSFYLLNHIRPIIRRGML